VRWTEEQFAAFQRGLNAQPLAPKAEGKRKFANVPQIVDGLKFDSKREAAYYRQLCLRKAAGEIRGFTRQVTLPLPSGKRRMRIDFLVVDLDGGHHWQDAKGPYRHDTWHTKRDEIEHSLGIKIELV